MKVFSLEKFKACDVQEELKEKAKMEAREYVETQDYDIYNKETSGHRLL